MLHHTHFNGKETSSFKAVVTSMTRYEEAINSLQVCCNMLQHSMKNQKN